jgi:transcriptional regulator with XRE-family HTH domain
MARALLRLSITDLAELAGVDKMVIVRFEGGRRAQASSLAKLRSAFEAKGVVFIGEIAPLTQPTVALRYEAKIPGATQE